MTRARTVETVIVTGREEDNDKVRAFPDLALVLDALSLRSINKA